MAATCEVCGKTLSVYGSHDMVDCVEELKQQLDKMRAEVKRLSALLSFSGVVH